jgi:hypothetical protein
MKIITALLISAFIFTAGTNDVHAASEDECAIWLCLPGGFPSGCGAAKSAMRDRIRSFKSPLPSFSSCVVSGGKGGMESEHGTAAYIPPRNGQCLEYGYDLVVREGATERVRRCREYERLPARFIRDSTCGVSVGVGATRRTPAGCTKNVHYIKITDIEGSYIDIGHASEDGYYYFDNSNGELVK